MQETDFSTRELARRAHEGDDAAFSALYNRVGAPLRAWARVRLDSGRGLLIEPEDVLHEVCVRAYRNFDGYDPDRATFRTWLFGIANKVLLELLRRTGSQNPVAAGTDVLHDLPGPVSEASLKLARSDDMKAFMLAARNLTDTDRRYLIHRGLEGQSHARVGEILGVSADAASKQWQRVLAKVAEMKLPDDFLVT